MSSSSEGILSSDSEKLISAKEPILESNLKRKINTGSNSSISHKIVRPQEHSMTVTTSRSSPISDYDSFSFPEKSPKNELETISILDSPEFTTISYDNHHNGSIQRSVAFEDDNIASASEVHNIDEEISNESDDSTSHSDTQKSYFREKRFQETGELQQTKNPLINPPISFYYPSFMGCRQVEEFEKISRIDEGMYGEVFKAKDLITKEIVALKRLKMEREREGFPITSLREINTLLKCSHQNVLNVKEVVVGDNMDKIFIVMEYVEHDLKYLMEQMSSPFTLGESKTLLIQLLRGLQHLHDNWIIHRDIKTSNLLISNRGVLKIADFGLAREYGSPLKPYTPVVVTLWYRCPELLLGIKEYSSPIDIWSAGCVFCEFLLKKPLFPAKSEIQLINRIFHELGTPNDKIWPGPPSFSNLPLVKKVTFKQFPYSKLKNKFGLILSDSGMQLLNNLLMYDPCKRVTAERALDSDFFFESPLPVPPDLFPTWPAKGEKNKDEIIPQNSEIPPKNTETSKSTLFQNSYGGAGFTMSALGRGKITKDPGFSLRF